MKKQSRYEQFISSMKKVGCDVENLPADRVGKVLPEKFLKSVSGGGSTSETGFDRTVTAPDGSGRHDFWRIF